MTCPNNVTAALTPTRAGGSYASFDSACASCPWRSECTDSPDSRKVTIGPQEAVLAGVRERLKDPGWRADYNAQRPKVERKLAHMLNRRHGGRRSEGERKAARQSRLEAASGQPSASPGWPRSE